MRKIIKTEISGGDFIDPAENYLGFLDFAVNGTKEANFKITALSVDSIPIPMSGKSDNKIVATLEGAKKALIISKGKRKALVHLFGAYQNWIGQTIKIVADPTVKFKGKVVGGLVIQKATQG
tara:strand:+ start:3760 stop:4125 length:366 start_codon:yes stop_codon:yes gene_type:complete